MPVKELTARQKMNRIYQDICGFEIPKSDEARVKESKGSPVYGEINFQALAKLLDFLQITKDDTFYDLGSGVGKVVLQTALTTRARRVVGIELSTNRYRGSCAALTRAQEFDGRLLDRATFLNEDLLTADLSDATIIYTCSTAFSVSFFMNVAKHVGKLSHGFRLVSLQELSYPRKFRHVDTLRLDMSWARDAAVYVYERAI